MDSLDTRLQQARSLARSAPEESLALAYRTREALNALRHYGATEGELWARNNLASIYSSLALPRKRAVLGVPPVEQLQSYQGYFQDERFLTQPPSSRFRNRGALATRCLRVALGT